MSWDSHNDPVKAGFIHLPGVLSETEVEEIRAILDKRYEIIDTYGRYPTLGPWWCWQQPKLRAIIFKPQVVAALRGLCGNDLNYIPQFEAIRNQVGLNKVKFRGLTIPTGTGWHVDSAVDGRAEYLTKDTYRMFKCGFYLQDNSEAYGGGVDIVPGCHTFPIKSASLKTMFRAKALRDIVGYSLFKKVAPLKAGDFLAFDYRLPHRSTLPKKILHRVTVEDRKNGSFRAISDYMTKYTLYFDCGNRSSAQTFIAVMENYIRANLKEGSLAGYVDQAAAGLILKKDKALMETMDDMGINMMTVDEDMAQQCLDLVKVKNKI